MAHTSGPWKLTRNRTYIVGSDAKRTYVARVVARNSAADVRLLLAAPDLLHALKGAKELLLAAYQQGVFAESIRRGEIFADMDAAIEKAEGR